MRVADVAKDDWVQVGAIARVHGLRGQVVITPTTDFVEERFAPGARVCIRPEDARTPRLLTIAAVRFHRDRPIVRFEGIDSIDAAEALGRVPLWVDAGSRAPLGDRQYYHDDLIGCRVETLAGVPVGVVSRVDPTGGAALLVIGDGRDERLVPLADAICRVIDPAARRIVIDPPEGLLDLNAPSQPTRVEATPGEPAS